MWKIHIKCDKKKEKERKKILNWDMIEISIWSKVFRIWEREKSTCLRGVGSSSRNTGLQLNYWRPRS